jgi:hypothetical protein
MAGFEVLTAVVMKGSIFWIPEDETIQQELLASTEKENKSDVLKNGPRPENISTNTNRRRMFKSKFPKYFSSKPWG